MMLQELDPIGVDHDTPAVRECLQTSGPMVGHLDRVTSSGGLIVETTLDPAVQPFLNDCNGNGVFDAGVDTESAASNQACAVAQ